MVVYVLHNFGKYTPFVRLLCRRPLRELALERALTSGWLAVHFRALCIADCAILDQNYVGIAPHYLTL